MTAIPKKSDKVGFRSMRYISLLLVVQTFYIRALQTAVRRERITRNKHLGLRARKIHYWCDCNTETSAQQSGCMVCGAFVASADVEGAFDCIKHDDVDKASLQKNVHPESVCSLFRDSCDLKARFNLPGAPMSPAFLYARGARQGSVEGPDTEPRDSASCSPRTTVKPKRAVVHLVKM